MTLGELATACGATLRGPADAEVRGVTHRAQAVEAGVVFAALPGLRHHGVEFAAEARERGAVAILSDRDPGRATAWLSAPAPRRAAALAEFVFEMAQRLDKVPHMRRARDRLRGVVIFRHRALV